MSGGRRVWSFACLLIVAAFRAHLAAAAPVSQDVPVDGGIAALTGSLGIDPVPDRARFMHEVTRLVYEAPEIRSPAVAAFLQSLRQPGRRRSTAESRAAAGPGDVVPVPLTAELWSDAVFGRKIAPSSLVLAIVADRQASLLCHGLTRLDDETLEFFAAHPALLTRIYERSAPLFAAFGGGIRIHENRVVPPGDEAAAAMWESAVGEKVTRAERFVVALLDQSEGRLAYVYSMASQLDPARRAFLLGSWMPAPLRLERFRLLTTAGIAAMREWHARMLPFGRGSYDLGMAVQRLAVGEDGTPLPPASRSVWSRVIGGGDPAADQAIDAAWILEHLVSTDVRQRGDRLDQLAFAQRIFGGAPIDADELVFVLKALPRHRALMLGFERAGFRNPATYAAALHHAARLAPLEGRRGYVAQAQFQGALAIVTRMMAVGAIDQVGGERLVTGLFALPVTDGYAGGVAHWIHTSLLPRLPASRDIESAIIAGVSGRTTVAGGPRVTWEGQVYRLDLAAAERQRLERVREKQHAPRIDVPLQMATAARLLTAEKLTADDLQDAASQFEALAADLPQRSREEEADSLPAGVSLSPAPHDILRRAVDELAKAEKHKDFKRAPRIAEPIIEIADDLLARNLLSFAYAMSLGDPEGTVLLATDVSQRHDFGFGLKDPEMRSRIVWAIPRQEVAPGMSWHVSGSLLALDAGLASLSLRRVATDHILEAPRLTNNARDTFATSVSLLDPYALRDEDRDAIADAIARGTERARAADAAALDRIAADLRFDVPRRRAVHWMAAHEPDRLLSMFSMTDLLVLGGGDVSALAPWGMAVLPATGCLCSQLLPPGVWPALAGRPQLGLEAAILPDLNLRIAMVLKELALPAALAKVVLSGAMQDFIDEVRPTDDGDWLSMAQAARTLTRERIEDYVASATATGPLMPEPARSPQPQP